MENISKIFGSIVDSNENQLQKTLSSLAEHQSFWDEPAFEIEINFSKIGVLLGSSTTRDKGFVLLINLLPQCPLDVLEDKLQNYLQICMKTCSQKGRISSVPLAFTTLKYLLIKSKDTSDLNKIVTGNLLKLIENVSSKLDKSSHLAALEFLEVCMQYYPGTSGAMKNRMEEFTISFIDASDEKLVEQAGICLHLLQQIRGGGTHGNLHKKTWNEYQNKLLGSVHDILTKIFQHTSETFDVNDNLECLKLPEIKYDDEPFACARQMFTRLTNLSRFLEITIQKPYPVPKPMQPLKILNLVLRAMSINCTILSKNPILENIAMGMFIPQIHESLLKVLDSLILVLQANLLPYANMICDLLDQALKWTAAGRGANGKKRSYINLRRKIYDTINLWCETVKYGSCTEDISEKLLENIVRDITPYQNEVTMKVAIGVNKKMSHKAKKRLQNAQYNASNLVKSHSSDSSIERLKNLQSDVGNEALCRAALECLTNILNSSGCFIKPVMQKLVQEKIVCLCFNVVSSDSIEDDSSLYSNPKSRIALYRALDALITNPHHLCPPPLQYGVSIFHLAAANDINADVRKQCSEYMRNLEKIIHPHKEVFYFPTDENSVRDVLANKDKHPLKENFPSKRNYDGKRKVMSFEKVVEDMEMTKEVEIADKEPDNEEVENEPEITHEKSTEFNQATVQADSSMEMEPIRVDLDDDDDDYVDGNDGVQQTEDVQLIGDSDSEDVEIVAPQSNEPSSSKKLKLDNEKVPSSSGIIKLTDDDEEVAAKVDDLVAFFVDDD